MTGEYVAHRALETTAEVANLKPVYLPECPIGLFGGPDDLKLVQQARERDAKITTHAFQDQHGNDVQLVSEKQITNGKEYKFGDGTKVEVHKDGSLRVDYTDGNGLMGKFDKDGSWTERHWGTEASRKDHIWTFYDITQSPGGMEKIANYSGDTGWIKSPPVPNTGVIVTDWGPKDGDNYVSIWHNRSERRIFPDGAESTVPR